MRVENENAREFYMQEAVKSQWSTRQLERQINSFFYERLLSSKNKEQVAEEIQTLEPAKKPEDVIRDPYVLAFLGLTPNDDFYENDAIENMVNFLETHLDYNAVRGKVAFVKDNIQKETIELRESTNPENTDLFLNYIKEEDTYCFTGMIMIRLDHFFKTNKGKNIYVNRAGQNWQIILPAVYKSKTGYIDKVVYNVVIRENSHSRKKRKYERCFKENAKP